MCVNEVLGAQIPGGARDQVCRLSWAEVGGVRLLHRSEDVIKGKRKGVRHSAAGNCPAKARIQANLESQRFAQGGKAYPRFTDGD